MKKRSKLGFSLIETSIAVLVIAILIASIAKGSALIEEARIKSAKSLTQGSPVSAISGLTLWLETTSDQSLQNSSDSYTVEDGNSIKNWNDINPSDIKFTATEATNMPTYKFSGIGGLPTLFFDAASNGTGGDLLTIPYNPNFNSSTFTIFIVTQALQATTDWGAVIMSRDANVSDRKGYNFYKNNVNTQWEFWNGTASTWYTTTTAFTINKPFIFSLYQNSTQARLYQNGTLKTTTNPASTTANNSFNFTIGSANTSNVFMYDGYISEIIYFNRALSDAERKSVESYLSKKYSIGLS